MGNMKVGYWFYATWLRFVIRYRKTFLGPLWLTLNPLLFTVVIGALYTRINQASALEFVPHLAVGLIVWSMISTSISGATTLFQRNRSQLLQGELNLIDIVIVSVFSNLIQFIHQAIVIVFVFLFYDIPISIGTTVFLLGVFFIVINGAFVSIILGILGARYHDLSEISAAVMRIGFLATPVIWLPGTGGTGGVVGKFLAFNPFFYFIEIVRAPLLNKAFLIPTWGVVIVITMINGVLALYFYKRFSKIIPIWI